MNDFSKLMLSVEEQQLVGNSDWILTKHSIMQKVYGIFGEVANRSQYLFGSENKDAYPEELFKASPKISRGENYQQLPYIILDYPRFFNGADIFVIRTMFWWGNFFSVTLQLSGAYKSMYEQKLKEEYEYLKSGGLSICVNESPWEHHFEANNYLPVAELGYQDFLDILENKSFVKLAVRHALHEWNSMLENLNEDQLKMNRLLT